MATIYDVAKECGFSLGTVSNVVNNGNRPVKPETRRRIMEVVQRLNYHPSAVARGLARQKTHTLGIYFGVVESSAIVINAYSAAILQGVLAAAAELEYNVTHLMSSWKTGHDSVAQFKDGRTDGFLLVAPPTDSDLVPSIASLGVPFVCVSWIPDQEGVLSVDVDDEHGARLVMRRLIELGHTKIAHLSGHPNLFSTDTRRRTYLNCLKEEGIEVPYDYLLPGMYSPEAGYTNTQRLLNHPEPPTAIFAGNDEIAFGVMEAARDRGVSLPEKLSVIGVDDRPMASLVRPSLTTVRQPFDRLGREAATLLIQLISGVDVPKKTHLFQPELVVRESTAPPST